MTARHTLTLGSKPDAHAVREVLRFARMVAREAAATEQSEGTRTVLQGLVATLSCEILDLEDAAEEDGLIRLHERDSQGVLFEGVRT